MSKPVNLMDAWLSSQNSFFEFIPSSKGYPAYRDPMADKPVGVIAPGAGEGELRSWKNRYAPNDSAI
jgi:hypothetical protein